jgi:membrane-associated protein
VNYWVGRFAGRRLSSAYPRIIKPEYLERTHAFFEKYGAKTVILARFVPIVRTFVPTVAGVSRMHYRTFVVYNILGGVLWGAGVTALGYFLGEIEVVKNNIEIAALVIVVVSVLPMVIEVWRHRRAQKA